MADRHQRPDPDALLSHVQAGERQMARGKLKIFFGYAAGVGKTYAMLEAARQRQAEGVDVVAAYVETHGRPETEALLAGLEWLPPAQVEYRGQPWPELDADAVLARRPELVLVDELAHSNVPGSRHAKRHQDVDEILAAGIDVYTTLNVQHLESLNDAVAQITGVTVHETLPDRAIDEGTELELIDLPPDELQQRLKEGKVYVPEQAAYAVSQFFRKGNLTALRELAMRHAAARVDEQMRAYMQLRAIPGPWPAGEHLLVCVGPSPLGERLVRSTRRLAGELNGEWTALYVETPEHLRLRSKEQEQLARTLYLAEELGGRALTVPGRSVASAAVDYAQRHNVTKIVAGKPQGARWQQLLRGTVVDQIIQASGPIDVYVISGEPEAERAFEPEGWRPRQSWRQYVWAAMLVLLGSLLGSLLRQFLAPTNLVMIYLLVVVVAALYLGRGPAVLAAVLGVLVFDFFFVPPYLTFAVEDTEYVLTFLGLLLVGLIISDLTARVRDQVEAARRREREATALYALSRDLTVAADLDAETKAVAAHAGDTFGREVIILLPGPEDGGTLRSSGGQPGLTLDEHEMAVATWAFQHGQPAGRGTDTLAAARLRYLPLKTARKTVGVLGVRSAEEGKYLTPSQRRLLDAFASLAAVAIERVQLAEAASQVQILEATEKLQAALLNSISHDLRTPLVSITGALSSLLEDRVRLDDEARSVLVETAAEEAGRLNRLVGNLLDMTRLEAGAVRLHREPRDLQDVIGAALRQVGERLGDRPVEVNLPESLPLVPLDFVLLVHVLVNLVDNALKYSPPGSVIAVSVRVNEREAQIDVADRGIGIPEEDLPRIFQKFYRVQRPSNVAGTGLGLSISKGLVEAHGGRIWAQNRPGGGAIISLALPLDGTGNKWEGGGP
ncbi:MAG TPA: sensor histidine kinase KdpD [Anaerolineae bacterium]|nr:sensor histidine kinase KdpD [Anaerolineae bacterium]